MHKRRSISIHALTRSATYYRGRHVPKAELFQSTHSRGVRPFLMSFFVSRVCYFNPRTHEECDKGPTRQTKERKNFNPRTHEDCDKHVDGRVGGSLNFNPRTHEECDADIYGSSNRLKVISIHALTRSATIISPLETYTKNNFNPRTHEECDPVLLTSNAIFLSFQSTHSRGVRP